MTRVMAGSNLIVALALAASAASAGAQSAPAQSKTASNAQSAAAKAIQTLPAAPGSKAKPAGIRALRPEPKQAASANPAGAKHAAMSAPLAAVRPAKPMAAKRRPQPAIEAVPRAAAAVQPVSVRRDPFRPLVGSRHEGAGDSLALPPGKAGLQVNTLHVDGLVRGPNGMIAVVSNPQQRVYFVREGDQLFDGQVQRIGLDQVVFRQTSKDPFGRAVERTVMKRIYPSAGEQQ